MWKITNFDLSVYRSTYPSAYQSMSTNRPSAELIYTLPFCPPPHLSRYPFFSLSFFLSIYQSINLGRSLSISTYLSTNLLTNHSIYQSTNPPSYLSINRTTNLSIYQCIKSEIYRPADLPTYAANNYKFTNLAIYQPTNRCTHGSTCLSACHFSNLSISRSINL